MDGLVFLFALGATAAVIVWTVIHGSRPGLGDTAPDPAASKRKPRRP
jgi:hypothetical protein